ncbi:uncharacterized protein V1477_010514 [Vespula maculifrons]|uniref:Uncharacterized protein n=1 Tax=Vespula maculifrons TaxID=7453 RepID=A0ABD2C4U8_VESMC
MQSRDTRSRETTTKSGLGPNFTVTSSVETQMQSRDTRIRETTIRSGLGPTLQLLVQLCFGLRRENLEIFADAIHAIGFERRKQSRVLDRPLQLLVQLSFGLRRENLEIFVDAFHATINEQLIQIYDGIFSCRLKCRVGILDFERRRQSRVLDRSLQLLVQLSFGLRQENLEIFADAIHASINEQLIQIYNSLFCCRLKCYIGIVGFDGRQQSRVLDRPLQLLTQMQIRDTRFGETTTQYGVGPNFTVTSSVVLLTSTGELRNLRGCHP